MLPGCYGHAPIRSRSSLAEQSSECIDQPRQLCLQMCNLLPIIPWIVANSGNTVKISPLHSRSSSECNRLISRIVGEILKRSRDSSTTNAYEPRNHCGFPPSVHF